MSTDAIVPLMDGPLGRLITNLRSMVKEDMDVKEIPALTLSLAQGTDIIYFEGFGFQDSKKTVPANGNTVFRVGSITKLFTDLAAMLLVQEGRLDLDVPVSNYLPNFKPHNPFNVPITTRHLVSHHSGLSREPPVGHYLDDSPTVTLKTTVESLNGTSLVHEPGTTQKYSNAAIAVVGLLLETLHGMPYAKLMRKVLLEPLRMDSSEFEFTERVSSKLAVGAMYSQDHRLDRLPPFFELGESPAGSLYSTSNDLHKFACWITRNGALEDGSQLLKPELFSQVFSPQFPNSDIKGATHRFGVGFQLNKFGDIETVGHGGAIYGYTSRFLVAPKPNFSFIILCSGDCAITAIKRISAYAINQMGRLLAGSVDFPLKTWVNPSKELMLKLEGCYVQAGPGQRFQGYGDKTFHQRVHLDWRFGHLMMKHDKGYSRLMLMSGGPSAPPAYPNALVFDVADRMVEHDYVVIDEATGTIVYMDDSSLELTMKFEKVQGIEPAPTVYPEWDRFVGEYGPNHAPTYVFERYGRLFLLLEWTMQYPICPTSDPNVWTLPSHDCFYNDEKIVFGNFNQDGLATTAECTGMLFERRLADVSTEKTFKINPLRPINELREEAMKASPSVVLTQGILPPDLVDLTTLGTDMLFDIRYATTNNFMGSEFYRLEKAFAQRPAAENIVKAHNWLRQHGFGLVVFDIYRPWYVSKMFWEATPPEIRHFVANPETGSIHNRGGAIDCSLYVLETGKQVSMISGFDEMTPRSYRDYPGGTSHQRWLQTLLRNAMQQFEFEVYEYEWWHFNYANQLSYPVLNVSFEELVKP